ncbi:SAF domain-containing protein [Actinomadura sp. 6N118]|uniref:SAF domain-containing protein n=1 Tax=Actinomadura sp. 6N118 TaxID=3375151 RepID=UPI0037BDB80A
MSFEQPVGAASAEAGRAVTDRPAAPPRLPRQRRRGMLALAVLLVAVGALLAVYIQSSTSHRSSVVVMLRNVPIGTPLTVADVGTTMIAAESGVQTIPGSQLRDLPGKLAKVDLQRGTLLAASQLTGAQTPAAGQQLVAVPLLPSQIPARGLIPGSQVLVVITQGIQGQGGQAAVPAKPEATGPGVVATVDQVGKPDADGKVVVDLLVPESAGPDLARQAAAGRVALNLTPRRP